MSLLAPYEDHCAARISLRSSSRTPPVVVILRGVMVASPILVATFLPRIRWPATPTYHSPASYIVSASTPSIRACAMFWYCQKCENGTNGGHGTRVEGTRSI